MDAIISTILRRGSSSFAIAEVFEQAITSGELTPGDKLPPTRQLAASLDVSPATVSAAYRTLRERSFISGARRLGTRVSQRPTCQTGFTRQAIPGERDLSLSFPDPSLLPDMQQLARTLDYNQTCYRDDVVDLNLINAIRPWVERDNLSTDSMCLVDGCLDGLDRVLREHARHADIIAIEDPAAYNVIDIVRASGYTPSPVAIDDDGPLPNSLDEALSRGARVVAMTTCAQNPFGAAISQQRATELRQVLASYPEALVIEMDFASELLVDHEPVRVAPHHHPRWALIRSFSKAFAPDLRLGVIHADPLTARRVSDRLMLTSRWVSRLIQRLGASLMTDPDALRTVARARHIYDERRHAAVNALAEHGIPAHAKSGLNLWIPVRNEQRALENMAQRGWTLTPGTFFRTRSPAALRACIATLEPHDAPRFAGDLADSIARKTTRLHVGV
ncbi:MAG: aminotransferase class I/II-fold pyridoxal phosphate-dependent enzyme [Planctomycetota bacterium]|jgi:DNA-binding transcriptional MocR family regulator